MASDLLDKENSFCDENTFRVVERERYLVDGVPLLDTDLLWSCSDLCGD